MRGKVRGWGGSGRKRRESEWGMEGRKARKWAKVWEDEMGGGSGDYRLSGVFYLWSKCTLAFLLSTPQMQLDSSLAKQTQMKWLLNDFLGNPPRQRKPSIWSLLFPSLPPSLSSFSSPSFSSPIFSIFLTLISCHFFLCIRLWFACFSFSFDLYCHTFARVNPFFLHSRPHSLYFFLLPPFLSFLFCCVFDATFTSSTKWPG